MAATDVSTWDRLRGGRAAARRLRRAAGTGSGTLDTIGLAVFILVLLIAFVGPYFVPYDPRAQDLAVEVTKIRALNPDLLLVAAPYVKAPAGAPTDQMGLAAAVFLYEVRSKRRTLLSPSDEWARHGEWSRDGVQIFYTRRLTATSYVVYRQLWDGSEPKRYQEGSDLVVGK